KSQFKRKKDIEKHNSDQNEARNQQALRTCDLHNHGKCFELENLKEVFLEKCVAQFASCLPLVEPEEGIEKNEHCMRHEAQSSRSKSQQIYNCKEKENSTACKKNA